MIPNSLRIVTFNAAGITQANQIDALISKNEIDILCIQKLSHTAVKFISQDRASVFREFGNKFGLPYNTDICLGLKSTGNIIFSRFPLKNVQRIEFGIKDPSRLEDVCTVWGDLYTDDNKAVLRIISTYLSPGDNVNVKTLRNRQIRKLIGLVKHPKRTIITGGFNSDPILLKELGFQTTFEASKQPNPENAFGNYILVPTEATKIQVTSSVLVAKNGSVTGAIIDIQKLLDALTAKGEVTKKPAKETTKAEPAKETIKEEAKEEAKLLSPVLSPKVQAKEESKEEAKPRKEKVEIQTQQIHTQLTKNYKIYLEQQIEQAAKEKQVVSLDYYNQRMLNGKQIPQYFSYIPLEQYIEQLSRELSLL